MTISTSDISVISGHSCFIPRGEEYQQFCQKDQQARATGPESPQFSIFLQLNLEVGGEIITLTGAERPLNRLNCPELIKTDVNVDRRGTSRNVTNIHLFSGWSRSPLPGSGVGAELSGK